MFLGGPVILSRPRRSRLGGRSGRSSGSERIAVRVVDGPGPQGRFTGLGRDPLFLHRWRQSPFLAGVLLVWPIAANGFCLSAVPLLVAVSSAS